MASTIYYKNQSIMPCHILEHRHRNQAILLIIRKHKELREKRLKKLNFA